MTEGNGPAAPVGFRKTSTGEVELRGVLSGGVTADGTVIFTLPPGYRPASVQAFPALQGDGTTAQIRVLPNGDVTIYGVTDNTFLSLEGIRFDAADG